jgi:hypothetical protein
MERRRGLVETRIVMFFGPCMKKFVKQIGLGKLT